MRILFNIGIILILPFLLASEKNQNSAETVQEKYCNSRYEFCVNYPISFFSKRIISDNGDGVILSSIDDKYVASIAGSKNIGNRNAQEIYTEWVAEPLEKNSKNRILDFKILKDTYEVTFVKNGQLYYQEMNNIAGESILFQLQAPKGKRYKLNRLKNQIKVTLK